MLDRGLISWAASLLALLLPKAYRLGLLRGLLLLEGAGRLALLVPLLLSRLLLPRLEVGVPRPPSLLQQLSGAGTRQPSSPLETAAASSRALEGSGTAGRLLLDLW